MYKRILLAYDGTHEGRAALFECAEIASFVKAETHLLAVATPSMSMYVEAFEGNVSRQGNGEQHKLMKNVLAEGLSALTAQGFKVSGHLAFGEPVEQICRIATELKCDLIVVGHKRYSRLGRWWRGSVSASLSDHAPCSVLIAMAPQDAANKTALAPGAVRTSAEAAA